MNGDWFFMAMAVAGGGGIWDYEQMRLGDALYWLVHDDRGLPRLRPRIVGLALAAGLLGELAQLRKIDVWRGRVVISDRVPPAESVALAVYEEILYTGEAGGGYGLADWLVAFRETSGAAITARLCESHQLRAVPARRSWGWGQGRVPVYRATDARTAALPWALLSNRLFRRQPLSAGGAFLVGVVQATGLRDHLLEGAPPAARCHAQEAVAALPPVLGLLVAQTEACIGNDVLTYRQ
jgi:hypothetical protein